MTTSEYLDSIGREPVDEPPEELETVRLRRRIVVLEKVNIGQGEALEMAVGFLRAAGLHAEADAVELKDSPF